MDYVRLDYRDFVIIRDLMEDLDVVDEPTDGGLDMAEKAVLGRVRRIIQLMEHKRSLSLDRQQPVDRYRRPGMPHRPRPGMPQAGVALLAS